MALFGRDYDRDYGYRGDTGYRGGMMGRGYDRGYRGGWNTPERNNAFEGMTRDDRGYGMYGSDRGYRGWSNDRNMGAAGYDRSRGYDREMGPAGYDREMGPAGYDRGYKSRWQTDFGDPFGDRGSRTPMRMIRGEYEAAYDEGYRGTNRENVGYGRDYYEANPMSYDPYTARNNREGTWMRGNERSPRGYNRGGYDSGWF